MPTAKQEIRQGFTIVARPGGYVSKAAVEANGWQDLVEDGPDIGGEKTDAAQPKSTPKKAGKATP